MFTDKTLTCRDCNKQFVFSANEQGEYASRGYTNLPGRCPECLAERRKRNPQPVGAMNGGYEPRERQLFPAVCATCGKATQVPFQPRSDRPVYCPECFAQQRAAAPAGARGGRW